MGTSECPVCGTQVDTNSIESHVNSHFDVEEPTRKKPRREESKNYGEKEKEDKDDRRKCDNCGELVLGCDWTRHISVHDDEAIAQALVDTPEKQALLPSSANEHTTTTLTSNTTHSRSNKGHNTDDHASHAITELTNSKDNYTNYDEPLDLATQKELDSFKTDQIRCTMLDITAQLRAIYAKSRSNTLQQAYFCGPVDHYASQRDDMGWGCGYRNIQMMCSYMMRYGMYKDILFKGCGYIPSIQALQMYLEEAWQQGYDRMGKDQLGRVAGTYKFIGTTECAALLRSFGVRCEIIDFHCHCCTKNVNTPNYTPYHLAKNEEHVHSHQGLVEWVYNYYSQNTASQVSLNSKAQKGNISTFFSNNKGGEKDSESKIEKIPHGPLYFQHHGHSRTIIGAELHKTGKYYLLVLDPSIREGNLAQALHEQNLTALKILRLPQDYFRHKRYQLARVSGVMGATEKQKSMYMTSLTTIVSPSRDNT